MSRNTSGSMIGMNQKNPSQEFQRPVTPIIKFEQNSSREKYQLRTEINITLVSNDIKPTYLHSQSILFRINPTTSNLSSSSSLKEIKNKNFKSEIYYNPKLEKKINQLESKLLVDLSYFQLIDSDILIIVNQIINKNICTELWLYGNNITSHGISILALSLINNSTLKSLDLSFNKISDLGVRSLTSVLIPNKNSSISILHLSKNGITNDGIKYLSDMLKVNQTLTELWLSNNEIGNDGIKQLATVLAYHNKTLKFLSLSTNIFITDISINYFSEIFQHNQTLKTIWLKDCNLTQQGKLKLREKANRTKQIKIEL